MSDDTTQQHFFSCGFKQSSFNKKRQPEYDVAASICDILIRQRQQFNRSAAACTFLIWNVALNLQLLGGRTSMATQQTHRELAPKYAAGKVPVPWGRKFHWETRRPLLWSRQRSFGGVVVLVFGSLQQQSYAMSVCKNAN